MTDHRNAWSHISLLAFFTFILFELKFDLNSRSVNLATHTVTKFIIVLDEGSGSLVLNYLLIIQGFCAHPVDGVISLIAPIVIVLLVKNERSVLFWWG